MKPGSLRLRLLAGTLALTLLTTATAGWGLRALFAQHIHAQLQTHLQAQLDLLSAAIDWDEDTDTLVLGDMASDARLAQPLSGLYWQVDRLGPTPRPALARSRSLWDQVLALPAPPHPPANPATTHWQQLPAAAGQPPLLAVTRRLQLPEDTAPPLLLAVAADEGLLAEPLGRFTRLLLISLGALTLGLGLTAVLQLHLALQPLRRLQRALADVRAGRSAQLQGAFVQELQPLVTEFNHVLGENAAMVQRARTQAGNLAHAVHTPLAILANAAGQDPGPLARLVVEQVASARRQVDWHLSQARATAAVRATGLNTPVLPVCQALLRTMAHLHARRGVDFALANSAQALSFRGEAQDLYEMLGNLIDNAGKWAHERVQIDVQRDAQNPDALLRISVDDDGPGMPAAQRQRLFERGQRADEHGPGFGLGLDIVRSLAESYGGRVQVQDSPLGGAQLLLRLPLAGPAPHRPQPFKAGA